MEVEFWGVRGTFPVPGKKSEHYGGNTNCVTLTIPNCKSLFIFDAGTGIKELSNHLMHKNQFPIDCKIFISHPHYDHINGIPFFAPLYMVGNQIEFIGTHQNNSSLEKTIADQMDSVYFPITIEEFSAAVSFHEVKQDETFFIDEVKIQTILLNHPGRCIGYRVEYQNKIFCYITDNELYPENSPCYLAEDVNKLIHFIENANMLIIDSTYLDEEYQRKTSWGHSPLTRVVDVAHQANVKLLCLYHHDPDQFDKDIEMKWVRALDQLKKLHSTVRCIAPREGERIVIV